MTTISINDAQSQLADLIHGLSAGDEVVITENGRSIARLLPVPTASGRPKLGSMSGTVRSMDNDFDEPVIGFGESDL